MFVAYPRELVLLELASGRSPFEDWLMTIKDKKIRYAVDARLSRIRAGNFGDHKSLGEGVFELKIDIGPGLRVYYGIVDDKIVVIIGAGSKRTQKRDIKEAKLLWRKFENENKRLPHRIA